jgi:hypothetical protein
MAFGLLLLLFFSLPFLLARIETSYKPFFVILLILIVSQIKPHSNNLPIFFYDSDPWRTTNGVLGNFISLSRLLMISG